MIYLIYVVLAVSVIFLASRLSLYVDLLDKTTNISGAFLGGVMLAAVTSIPELFTSLSSVLIVKEPELVMGNILGSNSFNLAVLGLLILFAVKKFNGSYLSKSHLTTCISLLAINAMLIINAVIGKNISILGVNIVSIAILIIYIIAVKTMSGSDDDTPDLCDEEEAAVSTNLSTNEILIRFSIISVLLIIVSILITYSTDIIAEKLNLGATFAGALLLAIATSLPEVVSSFSLVRKGNFNAAAGNILGSNLFNLSILFIADLALINGSIFTMSSSAGSLLYLGSMATAAISLLLFISLKFKNMDAKIKTFLYLILSALCASGYFIFLATNR